MEDLVVRLHGPQVHAVGLQGDRRTLAVTDQLQDVVRVVSDHRASGAGRGGGHQLSQRPRHGVVRVVHGPRDAVERGGEDLLRVRAEVRHDRRRLGGRQPARGVGEPEEVPETRGDLALVGDGDLRDVLDDAGHARRDPGAGRREGQGRDAAAQGHLRVPGAAGDAQRLRRGVLVVDDDAEVGHVGLGVLRRRRGELDDDEVELVRLDDALGGVGAEGHVCRQVLQRRRVDVHGVRVHGRQDGVGDARVSGVGEHRDLVGPLAGVARAEADVRLGDLDVRLGPDVPHGVPHAPDGEGPGGREPLQVHEPEGAVHLLVHDGLQHRALEDALAARPEGDREVRAGARADLALRRVDLVHRSLVRRARHARVAHDHEGDADLLRRLVGDGDRALVRHRHRGARAEVQDVGAHRDVALLRVHRQHHLQEGGGGGEDARLSGLRRDVVLLALVLLVVHRLLLRSVLRLLGRRRVLADVVQLHVPEDVDVLLLEPRWPVLVGVRRADDVQHERGHRALDHAEDVLLVIDRGVRPEEQGDHHEGVGGYHAHVTVHPEVAPLVVHVHKVVRGRAVTVVVQLHGLRVHLPAHHLAKVDGPRGQAHLHGLAVGRARDDKRRAPRRRDLEALTGVLLHSVGLEEERQGVRAVWLDLARLGADGEGVGRQSDRLALLVQDLHLEGRPDRRRVQELQGAGHAVAREHGAEVDLRVRRAWHAQVRHLAHASALDEVLPTRHRRAVFATSKGLIVAYRK
mmetsp:Transcript_15495/g.33929  ORF Transcript_15495/g.33929 Transcript_15495/m.33929 type:complete len:744 (-) Transcript_15495:786-3017(-)